jgi:hypothetical protein
VLLLYKLTETAPQVKQFVVKHAATQIQPYPPSGGTSSLVISSACASSSSHVIVAGRSGVRGAILFMMFPTYTAVWRQTRRARTRLHVHTGRCKVVCHHFNLGLSLLQENYVRFERSLMSLVHTPHASLYFTNQWHSQCLISSPSLLSVFSPPSR